MHIENNKARFTMSKVQIEKVNIIRWAIKNGYEVVA